MPTIHPGRYAAHIEGSFVVFLIGLRINRLLALNQWMPVTAAMPRMLKELYAQPELGLLAAFTSVYWRGAMLTQYWRSFEHLIAYAQAPDAAHLPAWKAFNQRAAGNNSVGIWHETYQVAAGQSECVYVNMPRMGLALAGEHVPATGHLRDARSRMNGSNQQRDEPNI